MSSRRAIDRHARRDRSEQVGKSDAPREGAGSERREMDSEGGRNSRDSAHFKDKLLKLRDEVRQTDKTGEAGTAIVELDQSRVGRLSRMDAMQDQAMSLESKRRRQVQLQRIASALQRLERNEFGFCLECGDEINLKRLSFDPTALYCIDCASEKGQ